MNKSITPTEHHPQPGRAALPLNDAATLEGTAPDALRMRFRRGTLPGYRDAEGRIFIYRDALRTQRPNRPNAETEPDRTPTEQAAGLVEELRRQLERLERREVELLADLRAERDRAAEERRRADILIQGSQQAAALASEQAARSLALLPPPGEHAKAAARRGHAVHLEEAGPTLSTAEAAAALRVSPATLRQWARSEAAPLRPVAMPGRAMRWSTAELRRLLGEDGKRFAP